MMGRAGWHAPSGERGRAMHGWPCGLWPEPRLRPSLGDGSSRLVAALHAPRQLFLQPLAKENVRAFAAAPRTHCGHWLASTVEGIGLRGAKSVNHCVLFLAVRLERRFEKTAADLAAHVVERQAVGANHLFDLVGRQVELLRRIVESKVVGHMSPSLDFFVPVRRWDERTTAERHLHFAHYDGVIILLSISNVNHPCNLCTCICQFHPLC
jgi:hypothetical protein